MSVSLLFTRKNPPRIGEIVLDLARSESHEYRSKVTQFPVEDGSSITDHIQNEPDRVTITGFVTNTPVRIFPFEQVDFWRDGNEKNRTELAYDALLRIHRTREPVKLFTNLREYDNMALESLSIPKTAQTGDVLEFTAQFIHIVKVSTKTVQTADLSLATTGAAAGTSDQGPSTVDKGVQNTTEATKKEAEDSSVLFKIGDKAANGRLSAMWKQR